MLCVRPATAQDSVMVSPHRCVVPSRGSTQVPGELHVYVPGRIQVARFLHLTQMQEGRACDYFVGRGTLMQPSACLTYVCTSSGNQGSSDVYGGAEDDGYGWFMIECTSIARSVLSAIWRASG